MTSTAPNPERLLAAQLLLLRAAGAEMWPALERDRRQVLRTARKNAHPDRVGNRELWDQVEDAAKTVGLEPGGTR